MSVALVHEHRFAFAYWVHWAHEARALAHRMGREHELAERQPPMLVSLDWHNDVGCPDDYIPDELLHLDPSDMNQLGLFAWLALPGNNDGHILPALHLDVLDDVHILLKQLGARPERQDFDHTDSQGRTHAVHYHGSLPKLVAALEETPGRDIILDIDLDYFTESEDASFSSIRRVPDREILEVLEPGGPFMRAVLPRLAGITLALEPRYCGGLDNSLHVLDVINSALFNPALFSHGCNWQHLKKR